MEDIKMQHHDKCHYHYMYHYVYIMPSMPHVSHHMPNAVLPGIHTPAMPMPTGPCMPMPSMPMMPSFPTAPAMDYYDCYPPKRD